MRIKAIAGTIPWPVVGFHQRQDLVCIRDQAVIILVPHHNNGAALFLPRIGRVDSVNDVAQLQVSNIDERRVQSRLRASALEVEVALRAAVAAPVLIIALVRRNEGKRRHVAGSEVFIQTSLPLEPDDVLRSRFESVLHTAEVHERIMLRGVKLQKAAWDVARNSNVGEVAVAIGDVVGARRRQALLVALPRHALFGELVRDRFAHRVRGGIEAQSTVYVDLGTGSRTLIL